jgi:Carboxypeptidase regulatory-like domain
MRIPALGLAALLVGSMPVAGQTPQAERPGSILVVVHDATVLPIAGAEVLLTAADGSATRVTTNQRGEARFEGIRPGVYSGRVESVGFNPFTLEQFSIRAAARVTREVTLQVAGFAEDLTVTPTGDDRRLMNAFTHQLTADQLAALPEDPEELALVLRQLVGDDADIRVDGFSGGRLPPGTQIQDVRIRYDVGASSSGGGPRVEIRTTPGGDRWRNDAGMSAQDAALNSRDAFSGQRPTGQSRQYSWNLNGPVVRDRTGLSIGVDGSESLDNQLIRAAAPGGIYSSQIEQPSDRIGLWTRIAHQFTPTQAIRVDLTGNISEARNQGIGEFDLPERAFTSKGSDAALRVGHHATLRRRYVNDLRFTAEWNRAEVSSARDERTIRVLDAFTSGGAEQRGGYHSRTFEIENELEFTVRRLHQITAGLSVAGSDYQGDEDSNAFGTYTFASLAAFEAGQPTTFTQRVGDPTYKYSMDRYGWFVQDDYRARRNLMINLGLRHDFQSHVQDWVNFSPRMGVSWTPSSKARTVLRASVGTFHSQLDEGTYRQTLLVNGRRQWDLVISSPGYPDPFSAGVTEAATPPSIIRVRADLEMPVNRRYSFGVDQPIGKIFRFRGTVSRQTGENLFRSRNANAPVDGVRPDPSVLNITELESTARSLNESVLADLFVSYPPRRLSANVSYAYGKAMSETDGVFSLPPDSVDVTGEWGPTRGDARHRVNASLNSDLPGRFRVSANFRAQSALPYNITSGTDANGDGVHNERPPGVTRNSGRGAGTQNLDLTLTWRLDLGQRQPLDAARSSGDQNRGTPPRGASVSLPAARDNYIFRFEVFARASNVLNLVNPQNFSGVLTSPFFGQPTSAGAARRVVLGTRIWF